MTHERCMLDCKATKAHLEYVILIVFPMQHGSTEAPQVYVIHTLPSLFLNTHKTEKPHLCSFKFT